jgi:hypothetical protein
MLVVRIRQKAAYGHTNTSQLKSLRSVFSFSFLHFLNCHGPNLHFLVS